MVTSNWIGQSAAKLPKILKAYTPLQYVTMGIIYIATSPSGKSYVGQTKYSLHERWRDHGYDAMDPKKDHCTLLNRAIRKYGLHAFELSVICVCDDVNLNEMEEKFIQQYNTLKPNGYNLTTGGNSRNHLNETKLQISASLQGRPKSYESLLKRSKTKKCACDLPMYMIHAKKNGVITGYRITHPGFPERKFADSKLDLSENKERAYAYLQELREKVQRLDGDGSK